MTWRGVLWGGLAAAWLLAPGPRMVAPPATPDGADVRVALVTAMGDIRIAVDRAHAPVTSANFLRYVDAGLYDGGRFDRTVRPGTDLDTAAPIQIVQASRAPRTGGFAPIALERPSRTGLRHVDGAVSMARSGPETATSDFFICVGDQPALDDGGARNKDGLGFAVFGRVVAGMDVVRRIQAAPVFPGSQMLEPPVAVLTARRLSGR